MDTSIFQSPEWEKFKLQTGYQKSYRIDNILVLQREIILGRTMLYSPMVSEAQFRSLEKEEKKKEFLCQLKKIAEACRSIFYRLELDIPKSLHTPYSILHTMTKSFEEMQPENNWIVDLTRGEEELSASMKQKCRYNIKVAQKNNLKLEFLDPRDLDTFYSQYTSTGDRHKVTFRSKVYFEKLLDILNKMGYAQMCAVYAQINGKSIPLSSAILLLDGEEVLYLYGGSSSEHKNLMAPYLLHWEIMRWAKEKGYKRYNFLGVAPDDSPTHPWAGITRFKKQFGGYQEDLLGCYDLVFKPAQYQLFKIAEKIRR